MGTKYAFEKCSLDMVHHDKVVNRPNKLYIKLELGKSSLYLRKTDDEDWAEDEAKTHLQNFRDELSTIPGSQSNKKYVLFTDPMDGTVTGTETWMKWTEDSPQKATKQLQWHSNEN